MLKLHPSSAGRWTVCPASVGLCEQLPEEFHFQSDNEAAQRGTRLHRVAEMAISGLGVEGAFRSADFDLTDEDKRIVKAYVDYCVDRMAPHKICVVEEKVAYNYRDVVISGVVDFFHYDDGFLEVVDFKTGNHEISPRDNAQLLCYVLAIRWEFGLPVDSALLTIVQDGQVKSHSVTKEEINTFELSVRSIIDSIVEGKAEFHAGPHCRWCPAAIICDHAHKVALDAARSEFSTDATDEEISRRLLEVEETIAPYVAAVRDAVRRILQDRPIPGWKLVPVRRRRWKSEVAGDYLARWLRRHGVSAQKVVLSISPAQAEKMIGSRVPEYLTEMYEVSSSVRRDDGREFFD